MRLNVDRRLVARRFMARRVVAAIAGALLLLCLEPAHARWPTPAAGASASGDPEVLFTFDDGPHEKYTAAILDELERRHIRAIFFWVGWRLDKGDFARRRALIRQAVSQGHLIANHTLTHANLCQVPADEAAGEIDDNMHRYEELTGLPMVLFRAPYGAHCRRLERMLAERSLSHMHWDIDPQEWSDHDADRVARYITHKLDKLEGRAIVIMHDTHQVTVRALPKVLDWIDKENERRQKRGTRRPIRIISGSDLVMEKLDHGVWTWAVQASLGTASHAGSAFQRLIP